MPGERNPQNNFGLLAEKSFKAALLQSPFEPAEIRDNRLVDAFSELKLNRVPIFNKNQQALLKYHLGWGQISLLNYMKILHTILSSDTLSLDNKLQIKLKLREGINQCTPGFFERVRGIVDGFYFPRNLSEHLAAYRKSLVEKVANQHSGGEVHTYNRFFVLASQRFAVPTDGEEGPYRGNLDNETIYNYLSEAFKKNYTLDFILFDSLQERLSMLGYSGKKSGASYVEPVYASFLKYLATLSPSTIADDQFDLFLLEDEQSNIIDFNWAEVQNALIKHMINEQYIVLPEAPSWKLIENELRINSYTDKQGNTLLEVTGNLFKSPIYFSNQSAIYCHQFDFEKELSEGAIWSDELVKKLYQLFQLQDVHASRQQLDNPNILMRAIQKGHSEIIPLLLQVYGNEEQSKVKYLNQTTRKGQNALMVAIQSNPQAIRLLLGAFGNDEQAKIEYLKQADNRGWNLIMMAARHNPQAIRFLLDAFGNDEQAKIECLKQVNNEGKNVVMIAAESNPQAIRLLLDAFGNDEQAKIECLKQVNIEGWNALMIAARYNPQAIPFLLDAFGNDEQAKIEYLKQVNNEGWNALMIAARYNPQAIRLLLDAFGNDEQAKIEYLKQANIDGWNALTIAVRYNSQAVPILLEAFGNDEQAKIEYLKQTVEMEGWNALMIAVQYNPQVIPILLGAFGNNAREKLNYMKTKDQYYDDVQKMATRLGDRHTLKYLHSAEFQAHIEDIKNCAPGLGREGVVINALLDKLQIASIQFFENNYSPERYPQFKADCQNAIKEVTKKSFLNHFSLFRNKKDRPLHDVFHAVSQMQPLRQ